jgi:hypothetical protein
MKIDLTKDNVAFAPIAYMENTLRCLEVALTQRTPCASMADDQLVEAISRVYAEL